MKFGLFKNKNKRVKAHCLNCGVYNFYKIRSNKIDNSTCSKCEREKHNKKTRYNRKKRRFLNNVRWFK